MGRIIFDDAAGEPAGGLVWSFWLEDDWEKSHEKGWVYGEWEGMTEVAVRGCPADPTHQTASRTTRVRITLYGGEWIPDFLALTNYPVPIASAELVRKLTDSGLMGYSAKEGVEIEENLSKVRRPHLRLFDVTGDGGVCRRWLVKEGPNLCPNCAKEPILCPGCGWRDYLECPKCGQKVFRWADYAAAAGEERLLTLEEPKYLVVEGRDWDGSDLFCVRGHGGGWFVNRRAKEWLERSHIVGFRLKPALLNIEGLGQRLPDGSPTP